MEISPFCSFCAGPFDCLSILMISLPTHLESAVGQPPLPEAVLDVPHEVVLQQVLLVAAADALA